MTKEIRKMQNRRAAIRLETDRLLSRIREHQQRLDDLADEHEDLALKIAVARLIEIEKREQAEKAAKKPKTLKEKYDGRSASNRRKNDMATSRALANALSQQDIGIRRQYAALPDEQKAEVEAAFRRHFTACRKSGIPVEPGFLRETLQDMRAGIHESVEGLRKSDKWRVTSDKQELRKNSSGETLATRHSPLVTKESVGEMVQTAFAAAGGVGDSAPVIIR